MKNIKYYPKIFPLFLLTLMTFAFAAPLSELKFTGDITRTIEYQSASISPNISCYGTLNYASDDFKGLYSIYQSDVQKKYLDFTGEHPGKLQMSSVKGQVSFWFRYYDDINGDGLDDSVLLHSMRDGTGVYEKISKDEATITFKYDRFELFVAYWDEDQHYIGSDYWYLQLDFQITIKRI